MIIWDRMIRLLVLMQPLVYSNKALLRGGYVYSSLNEIFKISDSTKSEMIIHIKGIKRHSQPAGSPGNVLSTSCW